MVVCQAVFALNINSWFIYIGNREIYSSLKNEMGDTVTVSRKMFTTGDTLFASYYQCGGMAFGSTTWITLMNESDQMLKGDSCTGSKLSYEAWIPMNHIWANWNKDRVTTICVRLVIRHKGAGRGGSYKIGVLRLTE